MYFNPPHPYMASIWLTKIVFQVQSNLSCLKFDRRLLYVPQVFLLGYPHMLWDAAFVDYTFTLLDIHT